jgi:tetratricopeptide (TPR) repeat protein
MRAQLASALAALAGLLAACASTPDVPQAALDSCKQAKDLALAISGCSEAIKAGSKDAQVYINRGFAHFLRNEFDPALADLNTAVKLDPKKPDAYARRGIALRARGEDDRAIADFSKAISLGAADPGIFTDRAVTYLSKGENEKAIADFTVAIERDADKTFMGQVAHVTRGLAYLYSRAPDRALEDFKRANELNPKEPFFAMWRHIAEVRTHMVNQFAETSAKLDMTKWPAPAIRMFLHQGPPEDVLAVKGGPVTICEADYLAAEFMQLENRQDDAVRLYRKAVADCPPHILEGVASKAALRSLGLTP